MVVESNGCGSRHCPDAHGYSHLHCVGPRDNCTYGGGCAHRNRDAYAFVYGHAKANDDFITNSPDGNGRAPYPYCYTHAYSLIHRHRDAYSDANTDNDSHTDGYPNRDTDAFSNQYALAHTLTDFYPRPCHAT